MNNLKILQISAYFLPSYRGTERVVAELSSNLVKLGHTVDILTINSEGINKKELWKKNINVYRCNPLLRYHRSLFSFELIKILMASKNYDVYHIHIPFHLGLEAVVLASYKNNIPIIANHHGEGPETGVIHGLLNKTYNKMYRYTSLPKISKLLFFTKSYPQSLHFPNYIQKKINVIKPGVDTSVFNPQKKDLTIKERYNFKQNDPVALFVSTLNVWDKTRGIYELIDSMKQIITLIPEAKLIIVGEGSLVPILKRHVSEIGLKNNIVFAGKILGNEIAKYYSSCDFFVLPSKYESFGFTVLEAMASGKPSIIRDIPGVSELIQDNVTGLKFNVKDNDSLTHSLYSLFKNKKLRLQMGENAINEAKKTSWMNFAKEINDIYQKIT